LALAVPLLCAGALDEVCARLRAGWPRLVRIGPIVVVVLALVDGLAYDVWLFRKVFTLPVSQATRDARFYQERGQWTTMLNHVLLNHGAIACDEEAPLQRAAELDIGDLPQVRLLDPGAGEVRDVRWTPNRVEMTLALTRPTTVLLNQNWNEHWRASRGRIAKVGEKVARDQDGGRLGVEVDAGTGPLAVYYRPRSFVIGGAISAVSIPVAVAFWLWRRRRRSLGGNE
jgi:hypothetical protein